MKYVLYSFKTGKFFRKAADLGQERLHTRWTTILADAIRFNLSDINLIKKAWDKEARQPEVGILSEVEAEIHEMLQS